MKRFRTDCEVIKVDLQKPEFSVIQRAAEVIKGGGLLIFPTDTVYGLGCSAFHEPGIRKIFSLKERPMNKPLPVLVNGLAQLSGLVCGRISDLAQQIIQEFWPGALTLIFPASSRTCSERIPDGYQIPDLLTGGSETIGVRMPACPLILDLITLTGVPGTGVPGTGVPGTGAPGSGIPGTGVPGSGSPGCGVPLVATSVNLSGRPVPGEMSRIMADWASKVDMILDAGTLEERLASTVIDLTASPPRILREGAISAQRLQHYVKPVPEPDQRTTE